MSATLGVAGALASTTSDVLLGTERSQAMPMAWTRRVRAIQAISRSPRASVSASE